MPEAPALAWEDDPADDDADELARQPWLSTIGYGAVLLACLLVLAFVIAIVGWVVQHTGGIPPLVTSDQINRPSG